MKYLDNVKQGLVNALKIVENMNLPKQVHISNDSFMVLGRKGCDEATRINIRLRDIFNNDTSYLIGLAVREHWLSLYSYIECQKLKIGDAPLSDNEFNLLTPVGYGEDEGYAYILYNHLAVLDERAEQAIFRLNTPFDRPLPSVEVMYAAAIYWFSKASSLIRDNDITSAIDWLGEAFDACSLANGDEMFKEGLEIQKGELTDEIAKEFRINRARTAAFARHAETRIIKADVFAWLDKNSVNYKSNDSMAEKITELQPIKYRTASKWAAEWKKLRSASTM